MENEFLIRKIVRSFHRSSGVSYEDLYQEAVLAYFEALQKHDPSKGAITTFVWHCISNRLRNYLKREKYHTKHIVDVDPVSTRKEYSPSYAFELLSQGGKEILEIMTGHPALASKGKTEAKKIVQRELQEKRWSMSRINREFDFLKIVFS